MPGNNPTGINQYTKGRAKSAKSKPYNASGKKTTIHTGTTRKWKATEKAAWLINTNNARKRAGLPPL